MIIAVDFDGTCVTHEFPNMGREIGAWVVLRQLVAQGDELILFTMRSGEYLDAAIGWFRKWNIPLAGINTNPTQSTWTTSPKAYAELYIDDAAFGAPLITTDTDKKPFIDWIAVQRELVK